MLWASLNELKTKPSQDIMSPDEIRDPREDHSRHNQFGHRGGQAPFNLVGFAVLRRQICVGDEGDWHLRSQSPPNLAVIQGRAWGRFSGQQGSLYLPAGSIS